MFNTLEVTAFLQMKFIKIIHHFIEGEDYIRVIIIMKLNIVKKKMLK